MELQFLSLSEALEIHQDQIARYGGTPGIRDLALLKSSLGMPAATFGGRYLHTDLHDMAAAYQFHLVQNHPFIDGNKRVGAAAALTFLFLNGLDFTAAEEDFAQMVWAVARGEMDKSEVAVYLKRWTKSA